MSCNIRLNITGRRRVCEAIDRVLTGQEDRSRAVFFRTDGSSLCHGVLIEHEGEWSLRAAGPGAVITECSLGSGCTAPRPDHLGKLSCSLLPGRCPPCERPHRRFGHRRVEARYFRPSPIRRVSPDQRRV